MNDTDTHARRRTTLSLAALAALVATAVLAPAVPAAFGSDSGSGSSNEDAGEPVHVDIRSPHSGDNAGIAGKGWFVDLDIDYPATGADGRTATGFTHEQLTGPLAHNDTQPFPGTFSPGQDDRLPGLVVLASTTKIGKGPGTNLANLFNLTGVTNRTTEETEIWDTWIVGLPIAGQDVDTTLTVAVVADLNHDGVYNDAPNAVPDLNQDGVVDAKDLKQLGVASNIETVRFHINGAA